MQAQDSSDPTGVVAEHPNGNDAIRARERKANAAIQLRVAGAEWEEIAQVLGYPTARAALVATERALERELRAEGSKDAMRSMAGKRLERLLRSVWSKAINENSPEQMVAVTKAREIIAQHTKLYGLDAPTEITVTSPSQDELEKWVAEVTRSTIPQLEEADIFDAEVLSDETVTEGDPDAVQAE